jgi:hypothetical protein
MGEVPMVKGFFLFCVAQVYAGFGTLGQLLGTNRAQTFAWFEQRYR